MRHKKAQMLWITIIITLMSGCKSSQPPMYTDTPTSGEISIAVDESFKPFIESQVYVFEQFYTYAKINVHYTSEDQAMKEMLFDTTRFAVIGRDINDYEKYVFDTMRITPRKSHIAKDALCFIVNNNNPISQIETETLASIFKGKTDTWKKINSSSKLGKIKVVFDQNKSSNVVMLYSQFLKDGTFPEYCSAAKSNEEVINYVKNNPAAMGVIGAAWISNDMDSTQLSFREEIKVLAVSDDSINYYHPLQAYIATGDYPLVRNVYIVSKEARAGLGTGLMSFITMDKGQRIILKSGLVPSTMPIRLINIKQE